MQEWKRSPKVKIDINVTHMGKLKMSPWNFILSNLKNVNNSNNNVYVM